MSNKFSLTLKVKRLLLFVFAFSMIMQMPTFVYADVSETYTDSPSVCLDTHIHAQAHVYNGKEQIPNVVLTDRKGNVINKNDYTLSVLPDTKTVGIKTVTVNVNGETYSGTTVAEYKILPKPTVIKKRSFKNGVLKVKWKKRKAECSGYVVQIATDKRFKKNKKTYRIKKNTKTSLRKKVKKAKWIRIRTYKTVNGHKFYSKWKTKKI